jgi:hypothetical protein
MASSSPPRASVWERKRSAGSCQACAPGFAFVLAIAAEFRRAGAATRRYDQLRRMAHACDDPAASPARRIYLEFYSDG